MKRPFVGWFEITGKDGPVLQRFYSEHFGWSISDAGDGSGLGLTFAFFADPEGHAVGFSRRAVQ